MSIFPPIYESNSMAGSVLICEDAPKGRPNKAQANGLGNELLPAPSPERAICGTHRFVPEINMKMPLE
jgi:hypothetical protein